MQANSKAATPSIDKARATSFPEISTMAFGAILMHAVDAWVLQVEGDTTVGRRLLFLGLVGSGALLGRYAAGRLPYGSRAVAMLIAGLVGLVTIGPIVGSYLSKQGLGGSRITGVVGLFGAISLIAIGTTRLVRMAKPRWGKLLAIPIGLVTAQFFLLPVGQAVLVTQAARPPLTGRTPADLGLRYENITINSEDGTELAGWYVRSVNGAAVLLRHGSGSTRVNVLDQAAFLAEAGYGVILVDARGHGDSEGRINELGWHGPQDISATVDYLGTRSDISKGIGILGLSMGGEEALNAAAQDERIDAVVAEGAGIGNYNDSVTGGEELIGRIVNWTQFAITDLLTDASQPAGIAASIHLIAPRPVLLIVGNEAVEESVGSIYARKGNPSTQLWMLPDTPHTDALQVHPADYKERVLDLFGTALLGRSTSP